MADNGKGKSKGFAKPRVDGEYAGVSRKIRRHDLLERYHSTPCSQEFAEKIVRDMAGDFGVIILSVRFSEAGRGWAKFGKGQIMLPAVPGSGSGYLQVGVAIHEVAHLIAHESKSVRRSHGSGFVRVLDYLLEKFEKWEKKAVGDRRLRRLLEAAIR